MELQDLLLRYFGSTELDALDPAAIPAALERMHVDFGLEKDPGHKFALWTLMLMLGDAPDIDTAFKDPAEREAARRFLELTEKFET